MERRKVFDLHCDTLDRLGWPLLPEELAREAGSQYLEDARRLTPGALADFETSPGHLSLRDMAGFAWCQCLAVFIPDYLGVEQSVRFFETISQTARAHQEAHPDLLEVVRDPHDIEGALARGHSCALLTIENGKLLAASPDMVERIDRAGVRMVTLTWNAANPLGSGNETHQGLTSFGRTAIAELEGRGIAVDVSHLNDEGFWEVAHIARRPFAASHSNARAVCAHPRNLTDDQFRAIRDAGGVCGLNYFTRFVTDGDEEPTPQDLIAHLEHWMDLGGEDVCALGSDYDGCEVPGWLNPARRVEDLAVLLERHFGQALAHKICYANAHDFFLRCAG